MAGPPSRELAAAGVPSPVVSAEELSVDPAALSAELLAAMGRVRRRLQRVIEPGELISATAGELLRLMIKEPGFSVAEIAGILHVAPNTVSTVLGQLTELSFVRRTQDALDRRVARFEITDAGHDYVGAVRDRRAAAMTTALQAMRSEDRAVLIAAIDALRTLAELLT